MKEKYFMQARKFLLALFALRKFLIQIGKSKKDITLTEVQIKEELMINLYRDELIAAYIIKEYNTLLFFIPSNKNKWFNKLKELDFTAKIIYEKTKKI